MPLFAVMAVGVDRPGNVAAVAGVLVEQGCNLEDTEIAVLRGYSSHDAGRRRSRGARSAEALQAAIEDGHRRDRPLRRSCAPWTPRPDLPPADAGRPWSVSVHGSDRPGHRLRGQPGAGPSRGQHHRYEDPHPRARRPAACTPCRSTCGCPPDVDGDEVAARLDGLAGQLNVACSMRPAPIRTATDDRRRLRSADAYAVPHQVAQRGRGGRTRPPATLVVPLRAGRARRRAAGRDDRVAASAGAPHAGVDRAGGRAARQPGVAADRATPSGRRPASC